MYRTRSDTQKLQRLIDFLKERGSDSAANLETSAADFLNDVKPKYGPGDIPYYDGDNSSAGSSFVEEKQTEQDDDWDEEDWEEWEDCAEELTEMVPEMVPPPRIPTPPMIPEPPPKCPEVVPIIVVKSPPPQIIPEIKTIPTKSPLVIPTKSPKPSPSQSSKSSRYKPSVVLSGVEKSSDVATPLIKFPTLPVSIPNFFSNGNSDNDNNKNGGKKDRKKNKVPEDAVESVLVDSMTVAAALVVPQIDPSLAQTKAKETNTAAAKEEPLKCPTNLKETETLHASPIKAGSFKSEPVQIRKLSRQDSIDYCSDHSDCQDLEDNLRSKSVDLSSSAETDSSRKSPLRSILKKTPSRTSLNSPSPSPKFEVSFANPIANCDQALESITETIPEHMILYDLPEVVSEGTEEGDLDLNCCVAKIQPHPTILESEPKSKLTELIKKSEGATKKHVTYQFPEGEEKVNEEPSKLKPPKVLKSPKPQRKNSPMKPLQPLQYNVPDDAKLLKVGGQRSRKPTLASQWRMQKERQKQEEQGVLDRVNTFEDWPYPLEETSVPNAQELADAGFFYMGLNDCVQCPYCEILLSGWSEMEDKRPWIQHAKTSPGCPYLERTKGAAWVQESLKS